MARLSALTPRTLAGAIVAASAAPLAAAFVAEYGFDLAPCPLCIWLRYPYAVAIVLGVLALVIADRRRAVVALVALAGLAFAVDSAIAFYHVGVEAGRFEGLAACRAAGETPATLEELRAQLFDEPPPPRCDAVQWSLFGVSMAGYNMLYAAGLGVATLAAAASLARGGRP
jgi:disulfide bond formation protein DsbB